MTRLLAIEQLHLLYAERDRAHDAAVARVERSYRARIERLAERVNGETAQ